jgi:regulatory protein
VARTITLRLLTGAPRSRRQLEEALARRGVEDEVARRVLDRFTEVGLVDDAQYAEMLVRSQRESRGLARRALAMELRRRGVGQEESEAALDAVQPEDEEETARALLRRRWAAGARLAPEVRARRAAGMLARKGYPAGLVTRLIRELMAEETQVTWDHPEAPDPD